MLTIRKLSQTSLRTVFSRGRRGIHVDVAKENELRPLGYWFLGTGALVAGMVTVGGVTRLTRSGLSMTDWRLQGSLPPITLEDWNREFDRYKTFPEWQQRKSMTLDEFKFIYFWEYSHRMMGRFIGVAFTVPGLYFATKGMIPKSLYPRILTLFGLGAGQGLIGWWMVKSGLSVDPNQRKEIRVSPYRLATHLSMAFATYTLLLSTSLNMFVTQNKLQQIGSALPSDIIKHASTSRRFAIHNAGLAALTIVSGAYVAGNDAGRAFNTFPKMGDDWIPSDLFVLEPWWRNFVENTPLVQFDHRVLALSTATAIGLMYQQARSALNGQYWKSLPKISRICYNSVAGMAVVQVGLGISTLLMYVPVPLAAAHQVRLLSFRQI
jgi:cytochrome c oxidase assembly protein subunit 15